MKIIKAEPYERYHVDKIYPGFFDSWFIRTAYTRPTFHRGMFNEDFARIFHSSRRNKERIFVVDTNDNKLMERLLVNTQTRHRSDSVDDTIFQLAEEIANTLVCFNKAYYFLHKTSNNEEYRLASFSGNGVFRLLNHYFQLVPKRVEINWEHDDEECTRELRLLDKNKLMFFFMPSFLRKELWKQNRVLTVLDKYQYDNIKFLPKATYENPNPKNDFDFKNWKDTHDLVLYRAIGKIGWNGRKYDAERCSDFFDCHRLLRFRKNQVVFRDNILEQLSQELTRLGKQFNVEFYTKFSGTNLLPNLAEFNEVESRLIREEISFSEVFDFCNRL